MQTFSAIKQLLGANIFHKALLIIFLLKISLNAEGKRNISSLYLKLAQ